MAEESFRIRVTSKAGQQNQDSDSPDLYNRTVSERIVG